MTDHDLIARALWERCSYANDLAPPAILAAFDAAGKVIRPRKATEAMKAAGSLAIINEGAGDFIGDDRCVTMAARYSPDQAGQVYAAMVAEIGGEG